MSGHASLVPVGPCQGISCAGAQQGLDDGRSGLLREVFRVWDLLPNPKKRGP